MPALPAIHVAGTYFEAGPLSISLANLLVILSMIVLFILALVLPFPSHDEQPRQEASDS